VHAYPVQLADYVLDHWPAGKAPNLARRPLIELLSSCFQASLMHEEGRSVRFHLLAAPADEVTRGLGEHDFFPLVFRETQALTLDNLRRLSPASPFHSTTICASPNGNDWSIWGLLHSSSPRMAALPSRATTTSWSPTRRSGASSRSTWSATRSFGLILFGDSEFLGRQTNPLKLKYAFADGQARERYQRLLRRLVRVLGAQGGGGQVNLERFLAMDIPRCSKSSKRSSRSVASSRGSLTWTARSCSTSASSSSDSGRRSRASCRPDTVWQALDVEAERRASEAANSVGTRHRAAYRFVTAHPDGLAVVVSHDGIVRFVANLAGHVVYWHQFLNW
jgi:hypothetical protein